MNLFEQIKNLWKKIFDLWNSMPRERRFLVGGIAAALIISIVLFAIIAATPHYRLLVAGLSEEEAGTIIQKLEEMNIPYKVSPGGDIYVSDKYNVYELRMKLASEGILGGTRQGFSILSENSFGATSFDKQVKYQIALQQELERSIMTIRGVKDARVHLVLPKYTYYVRGEMAEPRASVLVVLEPGAELTREQVRGIVELVSGAVEGLKPENVRVVDNYSRSLSDMLESDEETFLASSKLELKQQLEKYYENKLKKALESVFGPGRVEVIPDVSLNWTKIETEMKRYEAPARREGLVRSQETETERSQNLPVSGGEVGTESNIPPLSYPSVSGEGTSTYERTHTITNYELNEIYQKILQNHEGEISSLSVAVIIDASSTVLQSNNNWNDVINDLVEKGIGSVTSSASFSVAVAFLPFDRTIERTLQRELEQIQARKRFTMYSLGIAILGFLTFLLMYILIVQIRRIRARKLAEERRRKLEEEIKEVLQEEMKEEKELSPEEKELMELIEELENIFSRSPADIAEIVRLWFFERDDIMPERKLDGKRKAAVLLVALGPEKAAQVMKHLDEETVEQLVVEIANIGKVSQEEKKQVLEEFLNLAKAKEMISEGGIEYAKRVLEKAFGPEKARKIIERLTASLQVKPFSFIKDTDPVQLVNFLQGEHPQTIAVVLSYLDPPVAAQILGALPENLQSEVLKRIALLERTSPEVVKEIEKNLEKKISGFVSQTFSKVGGVDTAAEIMNNIDRSTEKKIMDKLAQEDPELADEIRRRMFVFEDILKLDDRSIQLVLREVDTRDLALALKGASDELKEKIFRNMSKRAAALLKDELEYMGPVRIKDVEEAQQKIINVIRRLEEAGEIVIARGGGEELIM